MSYLTPKWKLPLMTPDLSLDSIIVFTNFGISCIKSYRVIEGFHSDSPFGSTCTNKSLPSANDGLQNFVLVDTRGG